MNTKVDIKVYPNKLDQSLVEPTHGHVGSSLHEWLVDNVPSYYERVVPLFSAVINGEVLPPSQWREYRFKAGDEIKLIVEPKDPVTIAYAVIAVIAIGVAIYTANQIPDNYNNTTPDGSSIYSVNAQGNKPKLMGVIPQIAGRHQYFPDYLSMPRKEYIDNEEWLYLMLCVGWGQYEILDDDITIADTPVSNYAGDIDFQVFGPGEDVTGHEAHKNVYTSSGVGATSGNVGIELKGRTVSSGGDNSSYIYSFSGDQLVVYLQEWEEELGRYVRFKTVPPFEVGEVLTITGTVSNQNDGYFELLTKSSDGSQVNKVDGQSQDDSSWTGFIDESESNATVAVENGGGDGQFNGPHFACPAGEVTDTLWFDFMLPQGLGELDDNGNFLSRTVTLKIEYRAEGAQNWTTLPDEVFINSTNDQLARTVKYTLPQKIRPEVRVKRVTSASNDTRVYDDIYWTKLKCELETPTKYDGLTTIAVKIRGTNALASAAQDKFKVVATRILPVYENGAWSEPRPTRDIAPFFAYIPKSVGHGDDKLGLDELETLHNIWHPRGDEFNAVFDSETTVLEALKRVLLPGFSEPVIDYGKITPIRDQQRTQPQYMYTPDNTIGLIEESSKLIDEDEPDGVEVEFTSPVTWKSETILCLLPGDNGYNPEKVRAFGVTDRNKAYQIGMRKRRIRRYRRSKIEFKTEMDALNSRYLDYCAVADQIPGFEQTGRVEFVFNRTLYLDADIEWATGESHVISLRKPDGKLSGPYTATKGNNANEVVIDRDLDFEPVLDGSMEPPLFAFGKTDEWCTFVIITDIKPSSTNRVSVSAENDDPRVYLDDDSNAPIDIPTVIPPYIL